MRGGGETPQTHLNTQMRMLEKGFNAEGLKSMIKKSPEISRFARNAAFKSVIKLVKSHFGR